MLFLVSTSSEVLYNDSSLSSLEQNVVYTSKISRKIYQFFLVRIHPKKSIEISYHNFVRYSTQIDIEHNLHHGYAFMSEATNTVRTSALETEGVERRKVAASRWGWKKFLRFWF